MEGSGVRLTVIGFVALFGGFLFEFLSEFSTRDWLQAWKDVVGIKNSGFDSVSCEVCGAVLMEFSRSFCSMRQIRTERQLLD